MLLPTAAALMAAFIAMLRRRLPDGRVKDILVGEQVGRYAGAAAAVLAIAFFIYVILST